MEIECIFEIVEEALASIKYDNEPEDAFTYCNPHNGDSIDLNSIIINPARHSMTVLDKN